MLTAKVILASGQEKAYTEEFVSFSWQTANNEGTSFSASVPNLIANLKLTPLDAVLRQLRRGDKIEVMSDEDDGLVLKLCVIEALVLEDYSTVDISCSGNFFNSEETYLGAVDVPESNWGNIQSRFGLEAAEMHEDPPAFVVNAGKKEDIVMAAAWSFDTRRAVARTPFTSGDGHFQDDGVGVFKNTRPDGADDFAPVYKVLAEDIISYASSPAEPQVTHIRTSTIGDLSPVPAIPKALVQHNNFRLPYVAPDPNPSLGAVAKLYTVEAQGVSALCTMTLDGSTVVQTVLQWSDGLVNAWEGKKKIVGIFMHAFVEASEDETELYVVDRETLAVLSTLSGLTSLKIYSSHSTPKGMTVRIVEDAQHQNAVPSQILWFSGYDSCGYCAMIYYEATQQYKLVPAADPTDSSAFISAHLIEGSSSDTICSVAARQVGSSQRGPILFTIEPTNTAEGFLTNMVSLNPPTVQLEAPSGAQASVYNNYYVDFVVDSKSFEKTVFAHVFTTGPLRNKDTEDTDSIVRRIVSLDIYNGVADTPTIANLLVVDAQNCKFVFDRGTLLRTIGTTLVANSDVATLAVVCRAYSLTDVPAARRFQTFKTMSWAYAENVSANALQITANVGDVIGWTNPNAEIFDTTGVYFNGDTTLVIDRKGNKFAEVFYQTEAIPFKTRKFGDAILSKKIADGATNPVYLSFKVGALSLKSSAAWDKELGRISIDLSKFYVRKNSDNTWLQKSIQALNVMAVGSYVSVYLRPEDTVPILVKVTRFVLEYQGKVKAVLEGIVVE